MDATYETDRFVVGVLLGMLCGALTLPALARLGQALPTPLEADPGSMLGLGAVLLGLVLLAPPLVRLIRVSRTDPDDPLAGRRVQGAILSGRLTGLVLGLLAGLTLMR